jgi:hypothetical protein
VLQGRTASGFPQGLTIGVYALIVGVYTLMSTPNCPLRLTMNLAEPPP